MAARARAPFAAPLPILSKRYETGESVYFPSSSPFAAAEPGQITYTCVVITSSTSPTKYE